MLCELYFNNGMQSRSGDVDVGIARELGLLNNHYLEYREC